MIHHYHPPFLLEAVAMLIGIATLFILWFKYSQERFKNLNYILKDHPTGLGMVVLLGMYCILMTQIHPPVRGEDSWASAQYATLFSYITTVVSAHIGIGIIMSAAAIGIVELSSYIKKLYIQKRVLN